MNRAFLAIAISFCIFSQGAEAQDEISADAFRPTLDEHGWIAMSGSVAPKPGRLRFGNWTHYSRRLATSSGREFIRNRVANHFALNLGIIEGLAIGVDLPLIFIQDSENIFSRRVAANAIGDLRLRSQYRVWGSDGPNDGLGVAVALELSAPTATTDSFAGEEHMTGALQVVSDFQVLGAGLGLMLGYRHRFKEADAFGLRHRGQWLWGAGVKLPIPILDDFGGIFEIRGRHDLAFAKKMSRVEIDAGFEVKFDALRMRAFAGGALIKSQTSPALRIGLGIIWRPENKDADGDGIPDAIDQCVHLREDFDGFQDEDGCSDPDNDNDLIPDVDDKCPNEEAPEDDDENEDGCADSK